MKDYATYVMCGALCLIGCASNEPDPSTQSNTTAAGMAAPTANAGTPGTAAGGSTAPAAGGSTGTAGSSANGTAGKPATGGSGGTTTATAAGSGAGGSGSGTAGASSAAAGSGGSASPGTAAPKGSFLAAYTLALRDMCMSCHAMGGIFGSPDLSSPDRAYESLVDKDASMMAPGQCGGKGKLVTPGNCETSIVYSKITSMTPICGRRMPLSSDAAPQLIPQEGIDALCEWIKAGAKKD